jgi:hypothetical protein
MRIRPPNFPVSTCSLTTHPVPLHILLPHHKNCLTISNCRCSCSCSCKHACSSASESNNAHSPFLFDSVTPEPTRRSLFNDSLAKASAGSRVSGLKGWMDALTRFHFGLADNSRHLCVIERPRPAMAREEHFTSLLVIAISFGRLPFLLIPSPCV